MIRYTSYCRAKSLEEAYELQQKKRNIVLGGMIWLNLGRGKYNTVIDLCDLNLRGISEGETTFTIGAYTTLHELETDDALNACFSNAFRDCLCDIEGVQLRNMATAGGTVALRAGFSDLCCLLLALNARVELFKGGVIGIEDYIKSDRTQKDILMNIIVPKNMGNCLYLALRNSKTDLPVLNCSAARLGNEYRLAIGARPAAASLVQFSLSGQESTEALSKELADSFSFGSNTRASAEYRRMLAEAFIAKAVTKLKGEK